ncbi:MAG: tetratricopeptide repeat protein [Flavobacteriaceae bacterium]|nr:tetratricopeptide repeat protein [Flavobacteriaceae bacterium]
MKYLQLVITLMITCLTTTTYSQATIINTNKLQSYNHALELFQNRAFVAAQHEFKTLENTFEPSSEMKANCAYYIANCAIQLGDRNADELMQNFVDKYPNSTKRNDAFMEVANHYFKNGKYSYALKWFERVSSGNLSGTSLESYNFKYGYALFARKDYKNAKPYFEKLLHSKQYGSQAKYYYGYMAYSNDDYKTADKYLGEVSKDESYKKDISYYLADMNFKLGKFQIAINKALPLLEKASKKEHSEISKIIGESYFNLQQYTDAIPHLKNYKGKKGKWNNTDYYFIGYAHYKQNEYPEAISYFNKIIGGDNEVSQNAYYHLAKCYLNQEQKSEALNAFKNASEMEYNPEIQKDAWLNYAKLSYEIGNPYQPVPSVLQSYLKANPNTEASDQIHQLVVNSYMTSGDYQGAIKYLKHKKDPDSKKMSSEAHFLRGIQLFDNQDYEKAISNFSSVAENSQNTNHRLRAIYWLGESYFRTDNFLSAKGKFEKFHQSLNNNQLDEKNLINYNLAYTYFKLQKYQQSVTLFESYLKQPIKTPTLQNDSYLRIGDCYFALSRYSESIAMYEKALDNNTKQRPYAAFQRAISYGYLGENNKKITALNVFLKNYKNSRLYDDALYILGNTYMNNGKSNKALQSYNLLINEHPKSTFVVKSLLKKGIIYYNTDRNSKSLGIYKQIVHNYPNTTEARESVKNARKIYIDIGDVDSYATWVKTINFINITDKELDNDTFEAAEKQYMQQNTSKAISSLKKYLQRFPNGRHELKANYFLAQTLYNQHKYPQAIPYFKKVITLNTNTYTEKSLHQLASIYINDENWNKAMPLLLTLEETANASDNEVFAQSNLMKGYYTLKNYPKAESYAQLILNNSSINNHIKSDAQIIIARAAIQTNDFKKARVAYAKLNPIATGSLKAEALYYQALFEYQDGSYRVSNSIIKNIAANYATHRQWGGKSLIIMAKNFYALNDSYQATYILESVLKNFSDFETVVEEATTTLKAIKNEASKTNESIQSTKN